MLRITGLEALREIHAFDPSITVLLITAHGSIRDAVEAMREGAYNYIEKPVQEQDLQDLLHRAQEARALVLEPGQTRSESRRAMRKLVRALHREARLAGGAVGVSPTEPAPPAAVGRAE